MFYDYGSEKGFIVVDRSTMLRYLPDPAPSNIAVYVAPGANVDNVRAEVEQSVAGRSILIFTNRNLRAEAIRIFDRTFAITYALELVAVIVAIIGIAGALLAVSSIAGESWACCASSAPAFRRYASSSSSKPD